MFKICCHREIIINRLVGWGVIHSSIELNLFFFCPRGQQHLHRVLLLLLVVHTKRLICPRPQRIALGCDLVSSRWLDCCDVLLCSADVVGGVDYYYKQKHTCAFNRFSYLLTNKRLIGAKPWSCVVTGGGGEYEEERVGVVEDKAVCTHMKPTSSKSRGNPKVKKILWRGSRDNNVTVYFIGGTSGWFKKEW